MRLRLEHFAKGYFWMNGQLKELFDGDLTSYYLVNL